ncbi:MAG: TIGR02186 family protein [Proteobacteria bacterium]|nr:TIGR02186 family protein [Pseudomonadota bacterium]
MRLFTFIVFLLASSASFANPIISGISTNEINIDTKFNGAKILLFGAKGDAGDIVIAVRGPKKNFMVTKKQKFLGIWYNGQRIKFKESYSFYSLFSTFSSSEEIDPLLKNLELGKNNLKFVNNDNALSPEIKNEFQLQLVEQLEHKKLYSSGANKIDFLDETLFKILLDFPKNIARGIYTVEIYLISEGNLISFQSIPIYVNQVGISAKILDFAYEQSFLYGIVAVAFALVVGWLANYLFLRFIGK